MRKITWLEQNKYSGQVNYSAYTESGPEDNFEVFPVWEDSIEENRERENCGMGPIWAYTALTPEERAELNI
jgi:hypothetical protein